MNSSVENERSRIEDAIEKAYTYQWKALAAVASGLPYRVDPDERPAQVRSPLSRLCIELIDRGMLAGCVVAARSAGCVFCLREDDGFVRYLIKNHAVEVSTTVLSSCDGIFHRHDREAVIAAADMAILCGKFEIVRLMSATGMIGRRPLEKLVAAYRLAHSAQEVDRIGKEVGLVWRYLK